MRAHPRTAARLLALTLALPLAGCDLGLGPDTPETVNVEGTSFAPVLGVDLPASTRTSSGLWYRDVDVGTGDPVGAGDRAAFRYTGWFPDGTQFGSNMESGDPIEFTIGSGELIPGIEEGIAGMRPGGHRQLIIPPELAYGPYGAGPIPGNTILVVLVELVDPLGGVSGTFLRTPGVGLAAPTRTGGGG
jgi:hypothetical protein